MFQEYFDHNLLQMLACLFLNFELQNVNQTLKYYLMIPKLNHFVSHHLEHISLTLYHLYQSPKLHAG